MLKHVKEMSTFPAWVKLQSKSVKSDASPVLWDSASLKGWYLHQSNLNFRHQSLQREVQHGGVQGRTSRVQVSSKELEEQKQSKKLNAMHSEKKKKTEKWTGSEKGRNITRIQISLWKWKNGDKWGGNEKKHSREAKGYHRKEKADLIQGLLYK